MATLLDFDLQGTQTASDAGANDRYGQSVAISADGLVRATGADGWDDGTYTGIGVVYIDSWNGSSWVQRAKIEAPHKEWDILFGWDVALDSDGSTVVISCPYADGGGGSNFYGTIYTYKWNTSVYIRGSDLNNPGAQNFFGSSISISGNAQVLVVSETDNVNTFDAGVTGNIYAFDWAGNSAWAKRGADVEPVVTSGAWGYGDLELSDNGNMLLVGNYTQGTGGEVEVFDYDNPGWSRRVVFTSSDNAASDWFGFGVGFAETASKIFVSAHGRNIESGKYGGVYKFDISGATVTELGYALPPHTNVYEFGSSVSVSAIADVLVVGDKVNASISSGAGAAYIYDLTGGNGYAQLGLTATADGYHPVTGNGSTPLGLTATSTGYNPNSATGSAQLGLTATAKGYIRTQLIRQFNQEQSLSIGFIEQTRHFNQESALSAFIATQRQLNQENKISVARLLTRHFNQERALSAYEPKVRRLNQENSLPIVQALVRKLNQECALAAYIPAQRKLNQERKLGAYQQKQRQLNQESSLPILVEVIRYLNQECELGAYEPRVRRLNQENSTSIYKTVTRYLNGEYSLKVALQKIRQLNQSSELHAYQQTTRHFNQESSLLAYMPVVRFLDICYKLQADEKFFTFATNLETGATSEYTKYEFNSLSDGIGASSAGIYDLAGSTGDGANIDVLLELGKSDFGKIASKRVTDSYLGVSSDGNLKLTVTTESGTESYILSPSTSLETVKSNLARGHKGRWWSIKVENVDGSSIELESVEVLIQLLSRGR